LYKNNRDIIFYLLDENCFTNHEKGFGQRTKLLIKRRRSIIYQNKKEMNE
jgi:hypothetical protein